MRVFVKIEESGDFVVFEVATVSYVEYLSRGETGTIYFSNGMTLSTTRENCQIVEKALFASAEDAFGIPPEAAIRRAAAPE